MDMSRAIPNEESAAADSPTHQAATPSVRLPIGQIENVWYSTLYPQLIGDANGDIIKGMDRESE